MDRRRKQHASMAERTTCGGDVSPAQQPEGGQEPHNSQAHSFRHTAERITSRIPQHDAEVHSDTSRTCATPRDDQLYAGPDSIASPYPLIDDRGPELSFIRTQPLPFPHGLGTIGVKDTNDVADTNRRGDGSAPNGNPSIDTEHCSPRTPQPQETFEDIEDSYSFFHYRGRSPEGPALPWIFSDKAQYTFAAEFERAWLVSQESDGWRRRTYGAAVADEWRRGSTPEEVRTGPWYPKGG